MDLGLWDGVYLFISSANLTNYAMRLNMEMGVVVHSGPLPGQVHEHFLGLIRSGVLVRTEGRWCGKRTLKPLFLSMV